MSNKKPYLLHKCFSRPQKLFVLKFQYLMLMISHSRKLHSNWKKSLTNLANQSATCCKLKDLGLTVCEYDIGNAQDYCE